MTATASRTTNRRPELLAPAGGPEPFAAALAAGADAIYCGMGSFNARRKATNFTDEAFEQACRAAHLAGSRVYVTVNIVIKQSEMSDALQLIHRCSTLGADAFIIQDWGLFFEVKRAMPGIETHISTQANIHDDRGTLWCREQGADHVGQAVPAHHQRPQREGDGVEPLINVVQHYDVPSWAPIPAPSSIAANTTSSRNSGGMVRSAEMRAAQWGQVSVNSARSERLSLIHISEPTRPY